MKLQGLALKKKKKQSYLNMLWTRERGEHLILKLQPKINVNLNPKTVEKMMKEKKFEL